MEKNGNNKRNHKHNTKMNKKYQFLSSDFDGIPETIIDQLGGKNIFSFLGVKWIKAIRVHGDVQFDGITFMFVGCKTYNCCNITLTGHDTWEVVLYSRGKGGVRTDRSDKKVTSFFPDVYCDELQNRFEEETGLITSFHKVAFKCS